MADITEISRKLAERAQAVAEMLLPGGRKEGAEWRVGSIGGEKGQSLGVHLSGQKAGVWADFNTGETGDLLSLWVAVKRITLSEALQEARSYLGLTRPEPYRDPRPAYTRPPKPDCTAIKGRPLDYLKEDRNIPGEILAAYKVAAQGERIIFPYLLPDGTLALAKARDAVDGASPKPTAANCEPILFGWQAIREDARQILITEGEIDALSWAAYGLCAVSVPFGGGKGAKQQWIENEYDRLERFEKIYISTDMDKPGEEAAEEISSRLGRHRCYRVELPLKDANACLVDGYTQEQMLAFLAHAKPLDPEGLRSAGHYTEKVIRLFWPDEGEHLGYSLPYAGLHRKLLFRPSEVSLWSGAAGSGKSQIISDCMPKWIQEGSRICVASLEMKPERTLRRLVKQAGGVDRPSEPFINEIMSWLNQNVLIYERVGKSSIENMLQIFDYARAKYGCDQFIIDSLMRLGIASEDYTGQEKAVYQLIDWTIANNVHLHLVAHARKGERGQGAPQTEDIKGAMEIGANAFNIITIWRDRDHEERLRKASGEEREQLDQKAGVCLNVAKQRNGDFEGKVQLWFQQETYQYFSAGDNRMRPRSYVNYRKSEAA